MKEIFSVSICILLLFGCGKKEAFTEKKADITFISESGERIPLEREEIDIFFSEKNDPRIDNGKLEIRDPASSIIVEYKIVNGLARGRCTVRGRVDGQLVESGYTYYKDGIEDGEAIIFHEGTAIVLQDGRFENGKEKGNWKYYDRNQRLRMLIKHEEIGEMSEIITFDEDRNVLIRGMYKSNQPYQGEFPRSVQLAVSQLYTGSSFPMSVFTYSDGELQKTTESEIF